MALRLLFVCTGNTCRSPLAAQLAAHELAALGVAASVASAGTAAELGQPASAPAIAVARESGLDLAAHRAQPLTRDAIEAADLVLAMGEAQIGAVLALAPAARARVHGLREYATAGRDRSDVRDPFGTDLETYRHTLAELRTLVGASVRRLVAEGHALERRSNH